MKYKRPLLILLVALVTLAAFEVSWRIWRSETIVAEADFNPGIAPFHVEVRRVPVPATDSKNFIITLSRGEYPVTVFRYFWLHYTPTKARIDWPTLEKFTVTFDDKYVATCDWHWGSRASWSMNVPPGAEAPGEEP